MARSKRIDGRLVTTDTKTARSRRTIPLPAVIVAALKGRQEAQEKERTVLHDSWPESEYVFTTPIGTPVDPRNCSRMVKQACLKAGVRQVRLHDFRHGALSVLLGLGVPPRTAMEIAGHSSIDMTMNVYGHVTLDEKRDALARVGRLFEEAE
jgi:integrase